MNVFEAIFNELDRIAVVVDADGIIIMGNREFGRVVGGDAEKGVGRSVFDFVSQGHRQESIRAFQDFLEGGRQTAQVEDRFTATDGSRGYAKVTMTRIPKEASDQGAALVVVSDVTRKTEAQLARAAHDRATRRAFGDVVLAMTGGRLLVVGAEEIEDQLGELVFGPLLFSDELAPGEIRHQARNAVRSLLRDGGWDEGFEVAIGEALLNALQHAGGGVFSLHMYQDILQARVTDRGPGLDFSTIARNMLYLEDEKDLDFQLGVGFALMLSFSSRIFIAASDEGTTIVLESRGK